MIDSKQTRGGVEAPPRSEGAPGTELSSLRKRLEFQRLLSRVSTDLISLPSQEIDEHITQGLGQVGDFLGFNLVAICKFTGQGSAGEVTHIWTAPELPPTPPGFTELDFPWLAERLSQGHSVHLASLSDLPPAGHRDRQTYEQLGILSAYNWPLQVAKATVGCLGLTSVGAEKEFPVEFEEELKLLAQFMAGTLARARADMDLRASEARLDLAADAAGAGLWSLNLATNCFWLTKKTRELFSFGTQEVVTFDRFLTAVHPDDKAAIRQTVQTLLDSKKEGEVEYRVVRADGRIQWMLSRGRVQCNRSGKPEFLMGVSVDQTPRKQAEAAFHDVKATLTAIIDSTKDLIWSVDPVSFGLMTFNQELKNYFLHERGLMLKVGMRPADLFPKGEYVKLWREFYQRALREGPFITEYVVYSKNRTVLLSFNLLRREGEVFGVSVFGKDVTEQRNAQREAHQLRESLTHTDRVTVLGQLTSTLAHELSQPLGAILRNAEAAELILDMAAPDLEELRAIVTDIRMDDERAGNVISRLRSLLKRRSIDLQPVALDDVAREVLALVQADAALRRVKLSYSAQPGLPEVMGDRIHLQQVLLNLIGNAMDALVEIKDGCVQIRIERDNAGSIKMQVRDNGSGIPGDSPDRVFEPFFTTKASGMGLGLAVSKNLIEAHDGNIWAENHPEGGASFYFTLPVAARGAS